MNDETKLIDRLPWGELDNFIYMIAAMLVAYFMGWEKEIGFLLVGAFLMKMKANGSRPIEKMPPPKPATKPKPKTPLMKAPDKGSAKWLAMFIMLFLCVFVISTFQGCATFDNLFPAPPEPVCDRPEAVESVICEEFGKHGLDPKQYEDAVLLVVAVGAIAEPRVAAAVKLFLIQTRLVMTNPLLTVGGLFTWVQDNQQRSKALAGLINQKFPWLRDVDRVLGPFDIWLIEEHLKHIEELL